MLVNWEKIKKQKMKKIIKKQNKKGKRLLGGIIIVKGDSFFINEDEKYKYNPNDLSNWKVFEI